MKLEAKCLKAVVYALKSEPDEDGNIKDVLFESTGTFWDGFHPTTETHLSFPHSCLKLWVVAANYVFHETGEHAGSYELHIHVGGREAA